MGCVEANFDMLPAQALSNKTNIKFYVLTLPKATRVGADGKGRRGERSGGEGSF